MEIPLSNLTMDDVKIMSDQQSLDLVEVNRTLIATSQQDYQPPLPIPPAYQEKLGNLLDEAHARGLS
jgi:hypothetical protein